MRLFISKAAAPALCVCALLLLVACSPQDGSAPAVVGSSDQARTANGNATVQATKQPPAQHAEETRRITIEETQAAIAEGKALLVDVREESAYKANHIKGAKSVPLPRVEERVSELPKDKLIITYCACSSEQTSARAVQILKAKGHDNAAALLGGLNAWIAANLPMEKAQ